MHCVHSGWQRAHGHTCDDNGGDGSVTLTACGSTHALAASLHARRVRPSALSLRGALFETSTRLSSTRGGMQRRVPSARLLIRVPRVAQTTTRPPSARGAGLLPCDSPRMLPARAPCCRRPLTASRLGSYESAIADLRTRLEQHEKTIALAATVNSAN